MEYVIEKLDERQISFDYKVAIFSDKSVLVTGVEDGTLMAFSETEALALAAMINRLLKV